MLLMYMSAIFYKVEGFGEYAKLFLINPLFVYIKYFRLVVIENTFGLSGMGRLYWQGLNNNDFELVLAIQMFYSIVSLTGSLLIDISYGLVDPRVRVDK